MGVAQLLGVGPCPFAAQMAVHGQTHIRPRGRGGHVAGLAQGVGLGGRPTLGDEEAKGAARRDAAPPHRVDHAEGHLAADDERLLVDLCRALAVAAGDRRVVGRSHGLLRHGGGVGAEEHRVDDGLRALDGVEAELGVAAALALHRARALPPKAALTSGRVGRLEADRVVLAHPFDGDAAVLAVGPCPHPHDVVGGVARIAVEEDRLVEHAGRALCAERAAARAEEALPLGLHGVEGEELLGLEVDVGGWLRGLLGGERRGAPADQRDGDESCTHGVLRHWGEARRALPLLARATIPHVPRAGQPRWASAIASRARPRAGA